MIEGYEVEEFGRFWKWREIDGEGKGLENTEDLAWIAAKQHKEDNE